MKTQKFILVCILVSFSGIMFGQKSMFDDNSNQYLAMINQSPANYLVKSGNLTANDLGTHTGNIVCKKISIGVSKARVILNDGEKVKIPIRDINSYSLNGKEFDKLMVYENNEATGRMGFMEKVSDRDGFSLYKYSTYMPELKDKVDLYFVYKDGRYNCSITADNCHRALQYFKVRLDKVYVES